MPVFGKIFTSILNERILYWCDLHNKVPDSQYGFCKYNRGTADPLFIISTVIEVQKKRKLPLFAAFID